MNLPRGCCIENDQDSASVNMCRDSVVRHMHLLSRRQITTESFLFRTHRHSVRNRTPSDSGHSRSESDAGLSFCMSDICVCDRIALVAAFSHPWYELRCS